MSMSMFLSILSIVETDISVFKGDREEHPPQAARTVGNDTH